MNVFRILNVPSTILNAKASMPKMLSSVVHDPKKSSAGKFRFGLVGFMAYQPL